MATIFTSIMPAKVDGGSGPKSGKGRKPPVSAPSRAVRRQVDEPAARPSPTPESSFEADASVVLKALQMALNAVLAALPGRLKRSIDLQRVLNTDPKLAWQIYKFCQAPTVLPASSALPGAVAMERFHKLSLKKGVDKTLIGGSQRAFDAFERFVADRAGDRRSFNTMAGGGRDDGRATNLAHKKAVFRASAHFLGVQTDVIALTFLVHPSSTKPGRWDLATLVYKVGVRRLRPDARVMLAHVGKSKNEQSTFEPIEPDVNPGFVATLLPPFCSNASADTVITQDTGEYVEMEIAAGSIGTAGATNWAFGVLERDCNLAPGPGEHLDFRADISAAVQTLIVDVFVHQSVEAEPSTNVQTFLATRTKPDHDRLNLTESVAAFGRGDVAAQRSELFRHNELIRYACGRLGWNVSRFNAYRCRIEYPVLGSSIDIHLGYPKAPDTK